MSVGRVIGLLVLVVVLYSIITQPSQSAATTREGAGHLADAGSSVTVFLTELTGGSSADMTTTSQTDSTPTGGVQAGDGSTVR